MLFRDVIKEFIRYLGSIDRSVETITGYSKEMGYFNDYLTTKYNSLVYLRDIDLKDIEDYMIHLKDKGNKSASRSRVIYVLRSFYNYASDRRNLCDTNIAKLIEPVKVKQRESDYLSQEEFNELRDAIENPVIRAVVETIFYSGMRISEATNLKMADVSLENKMIKIKNGKGNKDRDIPISDKLGRILKKYQDEFRANLGIETKNFFALERTGSISNSYINREIKKATENVSWGDEKEISAHNLRHSFASNLIANNAPLSSVQKLLGHNDLRVTSRYIHHNIDQLSEAVNLL